jgi:RecA-family ATPase
MTNPEPEVGRAEAEVPKYSLGGPKRPGRRHPSHIVSAQEFFNYTAIWMLEDILDAIEATDDPNEAAELAAEVPLHTEDVTDPRAYELAAACEKAALAKSREVDVPPPEGEHDYGFSSQPEEDWEPLPRIVCPTIFFGRQPPPRLWIVRDWVPYGAVTAVYGHGGVGKSLLAQQLQTGTALGSTWLRLSVEAVASLGVYCEDDENELWRRQCDINLDYGVDHGDLGSKHWMPRAGENNILMTFTRSGVGELTKFHRQVVDAALDLRTRLVVIDTAADAFGGNENDRNHVRQFVQRALGRIAFKTGGAVVCCAHPSRAGLSSGEGDGGSTGWNNAFRSRLYLRQPADGDPNARILERKKANYASRSDEIRLVWRNGVIIPDEASAPGMTAMGKVDVKAVFLDLVRKMGDQKRPVSSASRASNYAPRLFDGLPPEQRYGFRRADFMNAMNSLFEDGKIENVVYGRKGDERTKIVVCDEKQKGD